jgi:hypothetical protein
VPKIIEEIRKGAIGLTRGLEVDDSGYNTVPLSSHITLNETTDLFLKQEQVSSPQSIDEKTSRPTS